MDLHHSSARHSNVHVQIASTPTFPLRFSFDCSGGPHASSALPPTMISLVDVWIPKYAPPSHMEASFPSGLPTRFLRSTRFLLRVPSHVPSLSTLLKCSYVVSTPRPTSNLASQNPACSIIPALMGCTSPIFPHLPYTTSIMFRSVPEMVVALSTMPSSFKLPTGLYHSRSSFHRPQSSP